MSEIIAAGLSKQFAQQASVAVRDVSLRVASGELFGLIGPDGAGKTTFIRMLATLLLPTAGTAEVAGHDVVRDMPMVRRKIGYMPGRFSLYQDLSVEENLTFFATVFGTTIATNYHLIADIYRQLEPYKDRPAGKLSGGMKQKLALCCALIHEPEVLLLDEPTTGVDPVSRNEFWDMLGRLRRRGITIFVSTPYMDEASRCDRIALMQGGKILDIDTLAGLLARRSKTVWAVRGKEPYALLQAVRGFPGTAYAYAFGAEHHVVLRPDATSEGLRAHLQTAGRAATVTAAVAGIEDVFIDLLQPHAAEARHVG